MFIEDGSGGGQKAAVNKENQLLTRSIAVSAIHEASLKGNAYAWNAVSADLAATETALCVANDSSDMLLVIEKLYVWSDVPTGIDLHFPAVATWTGTAVVGVNLNRTSNNVAPATAKADETGQATQGAIWLTLQTNELTTDQHGIDYDVNGAVILGEDDAVAVDIVEDGAAFECTIIGYFIDK